MWAAAPAAQRRPVPVPVPVQVPAGARSAMCVRGNRGVGWGPAIRWAIRNGDHHKAEQRPDAHLLAQQHAWRLGCQVSGQAFAQVLASSRICRLMPQPAGLGHLPATPRARIPRTSMAATCHLSPTPQAAGEQVPEAWTDEWQSGNPAIEERDPTTPTSGGGGSGGSRSGSVAADTEQEIPGEAGRRVGDSAYFGRYVRVRVGCAVPCVSKQK